MGGRIVRALAAAVLMGAGSSTLLAQSASVAARPAEFEVASVKLHTSADQRMMMVAQPGGRFVAMNIPLRMLIRTAYQLQDDQIVGGPKWLATDRFDIEARAADTGAAINPQLLVMLQSLLADRFKLTTHREKRELQVFALERARRDGPLGPGCVRQPARTWRWISAGCSAARTSDRRWLALPEGHAVQPVHAVPVAVREPGRDRSDRSGCALRHRSEVDARPAGTAAGGWTGAAGR